MDAGSGNAMDIRLVSSFTDDDEDRFALVLLKTMRELLGTFPIAYSVRVETTHGKVFQQNGNSTDCQLPSDPSPRSRKHEIAGP